MAPLTGVIIDIIENARWIEEDGLVLEISRVAIVHGLSAGLGAGADEVLSIALNHVDMPQPGAAHPVKSALLLKRRHANALGPRMVHVELIYKLPGGLEQPPPFQNLHITGSASIEQITSHVDRDFNQITVKHNGDVQGGQVDITEARQEETFTGTIRSSNPGLLLRVYANKVNSIDFLGIAPTYWFCSGVSWDSENLSLPVPTWRVSFNFKLRDGDASPWDPRVVYIDPETGQPPPNLEADVGYKTVPWYQSIDFNKIFTL